MEMDTSPYAFKTLWQEITKGITAITQGVTTTLSNIWNVVGQVSIHEEEERTKREENILQASGNNTGSLLVFGLVILAFLGIVAAKKLKK